MLLSARGALPAVFAASRLRSQLPGALMAAAVLLGWLVPRAAAGQETPYCRQARAKAASEADLLMAPRVVVQGIHFPRGANQIDSGPTTGDGYQVRTGLTFSVLDFYKGRGVLRAGDADCRRHEAAVVLDDVLHHATEVAQLRALEQQGRFLRSHTGDWRELAARAAARLSQRVITVVEFTSLRRSIDTLERKLVQVEGDAEQLKARQIGSPALADETPVAAGALPAPASGGRTLSGAPAPGAPLGDLAARYYREAMRFEQEASRVRKLEDWKLQITGGVVPMSPVDWYGTLELSFSLGALVRGEHEDRYLEGRSAVLRHARDGVETRLAQFRAQTAAALEQARRDLSLVEQSLEVLRATRLALQQSEAESAAQARDLLSIEELSVESETVFLRSYVTALESLVTRAGG